MWQSSESLSNFIFIRDESSYTQAPSRHQSQVLSWRWIILEPSPFLTTLPGGSRSMFELVTRCPGSVDPSNPVPALNLDLAFIVIELSPDTPASIPHHSSPSNLSLPAPDQAGSGPTPPLSGLSSPCAGAGYRTAAYRLGRWCA